MKRRTRWLSSISCRRCNASTPAYLPRGRLKSRQPSPTTSTESRKGQQNPSCIFWNVGGCHPGGLPGLTPESLVLANGNLGPFWQHSCSSNSCDFLILSPFPLSPHFITIWSPDLHRLCQPDVISSSLVNWPRPAQKAGLALPRPDFNLHPVPQILIFAQDNKWNI